MVKLCMKLLAVLLTIVVALGAAGIYWATKPLLDEGQAPVTITVQAGSSVAGAGRAMAESGLAVEPVLFRILARVTGSHKIHAGSYLITPGMTPLSALDKLEEGDVIKDSLTIVEGWTFRQMRAVIDAHAGLRHDTKALSDRELLSRITSDYTHPEGLFMPETFLFARGSSDLQVYRQAFALMQSALQKEWDSRDTSLPYKTPYDALIMASLVEKESGHVSEREQIAGVFVNRLRIGMRLQTDPTVIYGIGETFDGNIRRHHLRTDNAYNTYTRGGLPPTPIALAGHASLRAAFHPAQTQALYFVARGDGTSHFSDNLRDHNNAVNKFQRGGRAPEPEAVKPKKTPPKKAAKQSDKRKAEKRQPANQKERQ